MTICGNSVSEALFLTQEFGDLRGSVGRLGRTPCLIGGTKDVSLTFLLTCLGTNHAGERPSSVCKLRMEGESKRGMELQRNGFLIRCLAGNSASTPSYPPRGGKADFLFPTDI
jgi:hypothetical protein